MLSRIFYIARFNPSEIGDVSASNVNYSVIRKVSGTCSALNLNNKKCYIIRTSTGKGDNFKSATVLRYGKSIVITPRLLDCKIRLINYLINIIITTFLVVRLATRLKPSGIIFWDLLPDTSLPAIITHLIYRKVKLVPDIEEFISSDVLAPKFFHWYEKTLLALPWDTILTAGMTVDGKIKFVEKIELKGYFSESLIEEEWCYQQLGKITKSDKNSVVNVVFTGRVDNMRGFPEFLQLAKLMHGGPYRFEAFGFGDDATLSSFKTLCNGYVETNFHADRKSVLLAIMKSDYCFNFLSNEHFCGNSFPSKLVEYHCLGKQIVSNHSVIDTEIEPYVFDNIHELQEYIVSNLNSNWSETDLKKMMSFSIKQAARKLERI